ncbi:MAG TPA: cytochrome c biogenesis protein ResB [Verrucomicrobiae bacterium]|nr:cytochrome c biogenesis protein ResB [Verrucomicrobiae bacterium]
MLIKKTVEFFTSLKLTVVLLAFAIVLVFVGTLAQVDEGLYAAQSHYFRQWLVVGAHLFGRHIPIVLPGGYLLGMFLLVNLVSAHIYRFQLTRNKIGIQLAHAGVILLLVGQLATDMLAREMQMHFDEGQTRSYSESAADSELVFQNGDEVTAIPVKLLKPGDELKIGSLPFAVRVKAFWINSEPSFRAPMMQNATPLATNGLALAFDFHQLPDVKSTDERNVPTAIIELTGPTGSLGDWVVSDWAGDDALVEAVRNDYARQTGADMARKITAELVRPQSIGINGKLFTFVMRPTRTYEPFSLTLLKATHTTYPGTDIPKDFRSRVRIENAATGEKREVEISMNHPLRYGGLTFYQYQMDAGQVAQQAGRTPSSVLQVVRNPSWLTPYIGCAMVGAGLVIQFMFHLVGFVSKRK